MKVRLSTHPGASFDARLTTVPNDSGSDRSDVVLEVSAEPPVRLRPAEVSGCEVVEASEKELADLRAHGFSVAVAPRERKLADDAVVRMILPVGRSPWAIAAGYAGLFSLLVFPAPLAVVLGVVALRDLAKHPEKRGLPRAIFGLVMGVLGSALLLLMYLD